MGCRREVSKESLVGNSKGRTEPSVQTEDNTLDSGSSWSRRLRGGEGVRPRDCLPTIG